MTETPPPPMSLAAGFPDPDEARWRALAEKALGGRGLDSLIAKTADGIALAPLYRAPDAPGAPPPPGVAPFTRGPRMARDPHLPWRIRQRFANPDIAQTNREILADLQGGVSDLDLAFPVKGPGDFKRALEGVRLDIAPVALDLPQVDLDAERALLAVLPPSANAHLGIDPIGALMRANEAPHFAAALALLRERPPQAVTVIRADTRPVHGAGGSEAQEIAAALAAGAAYLREAEAAGLEPLAALELCEIAVAVGPDVLVETAKLRALRLAWARLTQACGRALPARIHAVTSRRMLTRHDSWTNLLRATAATFAAAAGGADAITTLPLTDAAGLPDAFGRRLARNTQLILMEESRLGHVADPAGGAWFVERLTQDLAAAAWAAFQEIEREGGIVHSVVSGAFPKRVEAARALRATAYATRKAAITGVSDFPLLAAREPTLAGPLPAPPVGPFRPMRWAEPFERLRDAAGARNLQPTAFFANLGALAAFGARANFTRSLFAAAGINAIGPEAAHAGIEAMAAAFKAANTPVAAICGPDEAYADEAAAAAKALKRAGADWVVLAGKPGAREAELRTAGVDQFVFAGQDAVEALTTLLAAYGVTP